MSVESNNGGNIFVDELSARIRESGSRAGLKVQVNIRPDLSPEDEEVDERFRVIDVEVDADYPTIGVWEEQVSGLVAAFREELPLAQRPLLDQITALQIGKKLVPGN